MSTIPTGQKFHTVASNVVTQERGSALANSQREIFTMQDIVDTVSAEIPAYKVYTAILNQSGTSVPVATVLENTLGGTVVWSYSGTGSYQATLTGAFTSKTFLYISSEADYNNGPQLYAQEIRTLTRITDDIVALKNIGLNFTAGVYSSGAVDNFTNVSIEIRVYP
jgi:hypothetical protein